MEQQYQAQKGAALIALRQGSWVRIGDWGAVAALETLAKDIPQGISIQAYLPALLFPAQSEMKKKARTHILVESRNHGAVPDLQSKKLDFDPDLWAPVSVLPEDQDPLRAALVLIKEAALLPFLLVTKNLSVPAVCKIDPAALLGILHPQVELTLAARARIPLAQGEAEMIAFRPKDGGAEQIALLFGKPAERPLVRLHSECFTGDIFHSQRCDCGQQLQGAMAMLAKAPQGGVLLYLAQEGRGIGLVNKLRAYGLQDKGMDTLDANLHLGFSADERDYAAAASMLKNLGFSEIELISNNPAKREALARYGVRVANMVRHVFPANRHNESYLATKQRRFGHLF